MVEEANARTLCYVSRIAVKVGVEQRVGVALGSVIG
jgi:putative heme iron utilization protein